MANPQFVGTVLYEKYKSSVKHLFLLSTLLVKNFLLVLWRENYKVLGENEAEPA